MASPNPRSWLDRAVGACFAVLVGAVAMYVAVKLIEAVWPVLLIVAISTLIFSAAVVIVRSRYRSGGW